MLPVGCSGKVLFVIYTSEVLSVSLLRMSQRKSAVNDKKDVVSSVTDISVVM